MTDISSCMVFQHAMKAEQALSDQYGEVSDPLGGTVLKCAMAVGRAARNFLSRRLGCLESRCRSRIDRNRVAVEPYEWEAEGAGCISKAVTEFDREVASNCTDADIAALDICDGTARSVAEAQECLHQSHKEIADFLIDVEHAAPGSCGDDMVNQPIAECDGGDASACPGLCGAPESYFPCLCRDVPRLFNRYEANADWDGIGGEGDHDRRVVGGGGISREFPTAGNWAQISAFLGRLAPARRSIAAATRIVPGPTRARRPSFGHCPTVPTTGKRHAGFASGAYAMADSARPRPTVPLAPALPVRAGRSASYR